MIPTHIPFRGTSSPGKGAKKPSSSLPQLVRLFVFLHNETFHNSLRGPKRLTTRNKFELYSGFGSSSAPDKSLPLIELGSWANRVSCLIRNCDMPSPPSSPRLLPAPRRGLRPWLSLSIPPRLRVTINGTIKRVISS